MYYIVNQTDHIIAADNDLLDALSVSSLNDLQKEIALGKIELSSPYRREIHITIEGERKIYSSESHTLSSLLGDMTLVEIKEEATNEEEIAIPESDLISLKDEIEIEEETLFETQKPQENEELLSLIEADEPLSLISDDVAEKSDTEEDLMSETASVLVDIQSISQKIGISEEDYDRFIKEYIDTALTLEDDLKSNKETLRSQAIDTLSHLSQVLHLSPLMPSIQEIQKADDTTRGQHITAFYNTLSRVVTKEEASSANIEVKPRPQGESFGHLDLSDVKPIHFDFQMEAAANDLGLPLELIEEFVIDFIDQAHIETEKMLEAYQDGDLDKVQKIGHLLKGTSSNLRIKPLADTLYNIQFCENSTELEDLIKIYWGHFLSFENQINITLKRI